MSVLWVFVWGESICKYIFLPRMPTEERSDDREHRGRQEDIFTEMEEKREEEKQRRFYVFKKPTTFFRARLSIHAGFGRLFFVA
ncbi:MAG: hypothetical protein LC099_12660 [Anaerolineales bacterium]|nr:hypothetical protein [Anaerolineales bacterium]